MKISVNESSADMNTLPSTTSSQPMVQSGSGMCRDYSGIIRSQPLHGLVHVGDGAHDQSVEPLAQRALPTGHGCDVGLHRLVTLPLRDLRVPTGEQLRSGAGVLFGVLVAVRHRYSVVR